jgi:hypothetical protein
LRRLILAGLALLAVPAIALGGATATDGTDTLKTKANFDPAKASKRKGDLRPIALTYDYLAGTTDDSRLPDLRSVSVFFGGAVFAVDAYAKCGELALADQGPSACPKGSKVGTGKATAELHPQDSTTSKSDVPVNVTIFNGRAETDRNGDELATPKDSLLLYTNVANTNLVFPFWAENGNTQVTFYNPEEDSSPGGSDNATYSIKKVHLVFPRRTRQKGKHKIPFVGAPRKCDDSWVVSTTNDRYEGGPITATHKVKCHKA